MRKRTLVLLTVLAALLLVLAIVISRERVQRRRVFRTTPRVAAAAPGIPPIEQWTETFRRLDPDDLAELLTQIEIKHPDLYQRWSLGYLHARALLEDDEDDDAAKKLAPFLAKNNPFRPLALYHQSTIAEGDAASRLRQTLILEFPTSPYREQAIEEEIEYLESNPARLREFAAKLPPSREIRARLATTPAECFALLSGSTSDDAADRVARKLDRAEVIDAMTPQQLAILGETFQSHRRFDRAIAVLGKALSKVYSDDLEFALGRSYFGAERYTDAERTYLRGAKATKKSEQKATFFWHAARAAQLRGDDKRAEELMTSAIAVPGKFEVTTVAITQRLRTRLHAKRVRDAAADLALIRKLAPKDRALVEASLAYAVGNPSSAKSVLNSVPRNLLSDYDEAEFAYWRGDYQSVLRAKVPTPYAKFARAKLGGPAARKRAVLDLQPEPLPQFPIDAADRDTLLMAMGLYDEAIDAIEKRWGLASMRETLTRSLALNRAGAARESIFAIEVLMKRIPEDHDPPPLVHQLLYPRYFYDAIASDAEKYDADPTLLLAIMREESRFNPRAKSQAAARGLLQFIITTARDIGRDVGLVDLTPEDLYDPRVIIQLGAKYVGELLEQFHGNRYAATAAYNAGPAQVAQWQRLQAAPGDDYFVAAINFDETKGYVRKVMNSYEMYASSP